MWTTLQCHTQPCRDIDVKCAFLILTGSAGGCFVHFNSKHYARCGCSTPFKTCVCFPADFESTDTRAATDNSSEVNANEIITAAYGIGFTSRFTSESSTILVESKFYVTGTSQVARVITTMC